MKADCISYKETQRFSKTLLDYLDRDPALQPHIQAWPDLEAFQEQMSLKKNTTDRTTLNEVLQDQYRQLLSNGKEATNQPVFANIEALKEDNTFTITTGHQLNVFTGPLYFIFKIVTAIRLAQDLKKKYVDAHFVPVFWMASEDHDFAEINHTFLFSEKVSWDKEAAGATGRLKTADMAQTVKKYQQMLGISEEGLYLADLMEQAYSGHETLAEATRFLAHQLFGSYGLIVLDADDRRLKKTFAPIMTADIIEESSHRFVQQTNQELEASGYSAQIHAREINFFYLTDQIRERILRKDDHFLVNNTDLIFTQAELLKELEDYPERFSPNVVMRPLYQELILPNLAYVGGGAEIVYWLQLKRVFDHFNVPYPMLIPRNSALIAPLNLATKMKKLDLQLVDLFLEKREIKKIYLRKHTEHRLDLDSEWQQIEGVFTELKERVIRIEPTLGPSSEAVKARLRRQWLSLEKKLIKADQRNHQDAMKQIDHLSEKLFPGGGLQERTENFAPFYLKYGDRFIPSLIKHFDPLDFKFTVLY